MANKPFGVEELNIVGSAGTSLIESVADLHIRVGGGRTVGIGTSIFDIQDGTADANNDSVLNVGIVTANQYYGTFKGTIDPGTSTLSIASSLTDVIGVNANQIYPKIASEDSILFWDFSEIKTTYLKIGDGVVIDGDTLKGDYTLPLTGTSGDAGVGEATWTLTPSSGTGDPVKLKAGSNVSIDATSVGSGEFTLNVASGAGITFTGIDVKQYSDNLSPTRTERTCSDPIVVDIDSNTATIAIGNTSNAYGERYIQTTEPTSSCDGDIWYDTSDPGGGVSGIPSGTIVMYNNTTAPTGWVLCDNSAAAVAAGAPDLRDRFIVSTGSAYSYGDTGGANSVTLTEAQMPAHDHDADASVTDPGHRHQLKGGVDDADSGNKISAGDQSSNLAANAMDDATTGISVSINIDDEGSGNSHENRPPYFALTFIMKT